MKSNNELGYIYRSGENRFFVMYWTESDLVETCLLLIVVNYFVNTA